MKVSQELPKPKMTELERKEKQRTESLAMALVSLGLIFFIWGIGTVIGLGAALITAGMVAMLMGLGVLARSEVKQ